MTSPVMAVQVAGQAAGRASEQMTGAAWVFLVALAVMSLLLVVALAGDAQLAAENRRLRRQAAQLRHPSSRPSTSPSRRGGVA